MAAFTISEEELHSLSGKVVVLTGGTASQGLPILANEYRWLGEKLLITMQLPMTGLRQ
jgi:hypothetical protein